MDDNHSPSLTNSPSGRKRSHDEIDLPNGNDIPQSSLADYNQSPSPDLAEERPAQNMASANNSMPPPPRPTQQAPSQAAHTLPASSIPVLSSDTLPEHSTGPLSSYIPQAKRNQISANARAAQWAAEREQQEQASRASPPKEATPETESQHDEEEETQEYWPESPSDVGLPEERMEEFDWADLQQRYGSMLDAAYRKEQELSQEFSHLVDYFNVWMQTITHHEAERSVKRLKTQTAFVQHKEDELEKRRQHYNGVVEAFKRALELLN